MIQQIKGFDVDQAHVVGYPLFEHYTPMPIMLSHNIKDNELCD
jgi:hypothetical protein